MKLFESKRFFGWCSGLPLIFAGVALLAMDISRLLIMGILFIAFGIFLIVFSYWR